MTHMKIESHTKRAVDLKKFFEDDRAIQRATLDARARLDDPSVGVQVKAGKNQVVRVTYRPSGRSDVTPVSEWLSVDETVAFLEGMQS